MRLLAHLSNLHIGGALGRSFKNSPDQRRLESLEAWMERLQPSLVAVSGNLTTSGSDAQLAAAKDFLARLPSPQIVVPGDRDVPKWDLVDRVVSPWERFEKYFGTNKTPYFADNEIVMAGIRTARAFPGNTVSLPAEQNLFIQELMATAEPGLVKILLGYRPLFLPHKYEPSEEDERVFRSQVDLFITGRPWPAEEKRGQREHDTTLFVGMGRAKQGFQTLRIQDQTVAVEEYDWDDSLGDHKLASAIETPLIVIKKPTRNSA